MSAAGWLSWYAVLRTPFHPYSYVVMPTATGFFLAKAIDSLGAAAFKPVWGVMMAEAAEKRGEDRARVMGVMGAGRDVGTLLGAQSPCCWPEPPWRLVPRCMLILSYTASLYQ